MSYEEVVFNRSYINVILLNRAIPNFDIDRDDSDDDSMPGARRSKRKFHHESELFGSLM